MLSPHILPIPPIGVVKPHPLHPLYPCQNSPLSDDTSPFDSPYSRAILYQSGKKIPSSLVHQVVTVIQQSKSHRRLRLANGKITPGVVVNGKAPG